MARQIDIVSVVGARPQFVKLAPVVRALAETDLARHRIIHTGQHYDERMSAVFFGELELPRPDIELEIGSASHGVQTGAMLARLESTFEATRPDTVLVYGDTNSTLAATLAAAKLHIPVAHIEAGLRSFNRSMPEEINRVVADHCGDRLYAPTPTAMGNLDDENLAGRAVLTGDVMRDAVDQNRRLAAENSRILEELAIEREGFGLLTIHRPVNTRPEELDEILAVLTECARDLPLVFPVHPRTRGLVERSCYAQSPNLRVIKPVPYLDMLRLLDRATLVVTDSGGVQKEAAFLGVPCITLRLETEWTETARIGINRLVGRNAGELRAAFAWALAGDSIFGPEVATELDRHFGKGDAAKVIVEDLLAWRSGANSPVSRQPR